MEDSSGTSRNIILGVVLLLLVLGGGFYYWTMRLESQTYDTYFAEDSFDDGVSVQEPYTTTSSATADFMTFTHNNDGFSIDYPVAWEMDTSSVLVPVAFYSPFSSDADFFQDNVNVTTEDTTPYGEISLNDYAAAGLENIQLSLPEYTLVEQGARTFGQGNYEGAYLLGEYVAPDITLNIYSLFTVVEGTAYVITYSYNPEEEELYQVTVDMMMASFKVS